MSCDDLLLLTSKGMPYSDKTNDHIQTTQIVDQMEMKTALEGITIKNVLDSQLVFSGQRLRKTLPRRIVEIEESIKKGLDTRHITILVLELEDGRFELLGGYHRVEACRNLYRNDRTYVERLVKDDVLFFPAQVLQNSVPRKVAECLAVRSNVLNETATAMEWNDYVDRMITCFDHQDVLNQNTFPKIWEKETNVKLKKDAYKRARRIAVWLIKNEAVPLWISLNLRRKIPHSHFNALFKVEKYSSMICRIMLLAVYFEKKDIVPRLAAHFETLQEDTRLAVEVQRFISSKFNVSLLPEKAKPAEISGFISQVYKKRDAIEADLNRRYPTYKNFTLCALIDGKEVMLEGFGL